VVTLRLVTDEEVPGPPAEPRRHECVACFVDRMTRAYGCSDHLSWVARWRDRCAPRATALERRLRAKGGYCDCEMLTNVYARSEWLREQWEWAGEDDGESADGASVGAEAESAPPPCLGVRRGSTQPCPHWVAPYR
jgi:Protein of unknown function (DUF2695)